MSPKVVPLLPPARKAAAGRVRRARLARGWSQEELARRARVSVRTVRDIELGRVRMTALELLEVLEGHAVPNKEAA